MEITRKRVRPELQEYFTNVCHACDGLGWVFSAESVAARIDRDMRRTQFKNQDVHLAVHPAVNAYLLKESRQVKKMLEKEHNCHLTITEDGDLDQDEYTITPQKGPGKSAC
jgi:ribonuclease G